MSNIFHKNQKSFLVQRRRALKLLSALPLIALTPRYAAARTPIAAEGPFYPEPAMRFADVDNNLVKIVGLVKEAGGEIIVLKGKVYNRAGWPLAGARVEIWQCDVNGRYLHIGDRSSNVPRDTAFQGFGHVVTGPDGAYVFRTIKPVSYPGRAPHIHVKVFHDRRELTTQFYISNHEMNERDWLFQSMSTKAQRKVSMIFEAGVSGQETTVDIVI